MTKKDVCEFELNGITNKAFENEEKASPLNPEFTNKKSDEESSKVKPVPYFKLFKYSNAFEKFLIFFGIFLACWSGVCLPAINVLYGEFTNMLVDREFPTRNSTPTVLLHLFGGGRIIINGTKDDIREALHEDSRAFAIGCALLSAFQFITGAVSVYLLNFAAHKQISRIRRLFLEAVLSQDMAWFDTQGASNFASRITDDLNKYEEGIGGRISIFVYMVVGFASAVLYAFIVGWKLTLAMIATAPILIISTSIVAKVQSSLTTKELLSYGLAGIIAEEVFSAIRTVVAFSGEKKEVERYSNHLRPSVKMGVKRGVLSGFGGGLLWLITYCCYAVAFYYGVRLILWSRASGDNEYNPAVLVIVFFGVVMAATNLGNAAPHIEAFAVAKGAAAAIFQVLETKSAINPLSETGKSLEQFEGNIELRDVHFSYPARSQVKVLNGLNLKIKAGEMVALVGASGCGKSTVLQLVQRLYDPSKGDVLLDGVNIKDLNVSWVRKQLGVVGQEPLLFATTVNENIKYGLEGATDEDVTESAKKANAHDFIMKLMEGYDTVVGQKGSTLSGGQKQRIAIARALIRNPHILLLDEATSALDAASERIVQAALDEAAKGRTTLVISHRLSTIRNVDRIVVISDGVVVEEGTHDQLIALKGRYSELLKTQDAMLAEAKNQGMKKGREDSTTELEFNFEDSSTNLPRGPGNRGSLFLSYRDVPKTQSAMLRQDQEQLVETSFKDMMMWNKPEWYFLLIGAVSSIIAGAGLPSVCVLFGELYGFLSLTDANVILVKTDFYALLLVIAGIVAGVGVFLQMYMFAVAGVRMTTRLRIKAFESVIRQEIGWFDEERNRVGALCTRLSQDAAGVQGATGGRLGIILQAFSTMTIGTVLSFFYTWKMTLVTLVTVPFVFSGVYMESVLIKGQSMAEKKSLEAASKVAIEAINNIRAVASLSREKAILRTYSLELHKGEKGLQRKSKIRGFAFAIGQTAPFFGYALSLWYGGMLVADEGLHYKEVLKVSELLIFGSWMLGQSVIFAPNFGQAKLSASRLNYLFSRKPKVNDGPISREPEWDKDGRVRYSKVRFAYPVRPESEILQGLDLTVLKGQSVALVGPSGCGKSTVIQLLQRLYDPTSGTITMEQTNIREMKLSTLRSQLGLVSQEPVLFDRTIQENIAYGDNSRDILEEEVIEAAKGANIHNFIASLPLGYGTRLGHGGAQLSGGQKQRIAIARALVRNPRILLLDEATSALDPESEQIVQAALDAASEGRTTITIAHRLGAVANADIIYVIDKGQVVESGNHNKLMSLGGVYYEMHKTSV